jgi:hypothetical protein
VKLEIPVPGLLDLPADASFTGRNGRANVSVSLRGDTISITSSCDSLQTLCEYYERELARIRSDTLSEKKETKKEVSTGIYSPFKLLLIGFIAGVIVTIIISIKFKK